MPDNYRLIESAKSRIIERDREMTVLEPEDVVSKIEYPNGRETYENGFTDYHKGDRD